MHNTEQTSFYLWRIDFFVSENTEFQNTHLYRLGGDICTVNAKSCTQLLKDLLTIYIVTACKIDLDQ